VEAEQEHQWVLQARHGNQEAFARLVQAYQTPVYNLAYRMLGSPADAEDATQETFVRAYTRLNTFEAGRKLSSWILSIAAHYGVDRLRRRHGAQMSVEETESLQWIADGKPKPEEQVIEREQNKSVHHVLEALPAQYRIVIVLRYWQDLSYQEIAEITESTESAVKSRLHRAREMMALQMDKAETPPKPEKKAQELSGRAVQRKVAEHAMS
jgi:RNA polymerase sigma-70 factor, ECF subfamily